MKTLRADVVVLGGGAAGALAAVAAKRAGASVLMLRRGDGATQQSSGAVDVAEFHGGIPVGRNRSAFESGAPWLEAARHLGDSVPFHPYSRVPGAVSGLPQALELLTSVAASANLAGSAHAAGKNLVLASSMGTVKRSALAQHAQALGDWSALPTASRIGVVHVPQLGQGDGANAQAVLAAVRARSPADATFPELVLLTPEGLVDTLDALRAPRDVAAKWETPEGLARLVAALKRELTRQGPVQLILMPPLLGRSNAAAVSSFLSKELGGPVAETLSLPPSVPGERLQRALDEGVAREEITVLDGEAQDSEKDGSSARAVHVDLISGRVRVEATAWVLATGKFLSGGIRREDRFFEPVFGLPVFVDGKHVDAGYVGDWTGELPEMAQAFMRAGVLTNATLQPLDAYGAAVALKNVFAAGSVLTGYDATRHRSGIGVAAVTGMLAGRFAAAWKR